MIKRTNLLLLMLVKWKIKILHLYGILRPPKTFGGLISNKCTNYATDPVVPVKIIIRINLNSWKNIFSKVNIGKLIL